MAFFWKICLQVYNGNVNSDKMVTNELTEGVVRARYFRIYPRGFFGQMALRFDLIGTGPNGEYMNVIRLSMMQL